ncbi:MAG: recombinase family protein [Ancrocorticia sp.]
MRIGYARVSTEDQNESAQRLALRAAGVDQIFVDHASGKDLDRPAWQECRQTLRAGDVLIVVRLDRLGRSLADLVETIQALGVEGIEFQSLTENIDTTTPAGRLLFHISASFAEYEREITRVRTREGLAAARERGARLGRPHALTAEQVATVRNLHASGQSVSALARVFHVSRATIARTLR